MKFFILTCLVFLTLATSSYSQQYRVKEADNDSENPSHFLLLTPSNDYIDISGPLPYGKSKKTPSIVRYDSKMKIVYNNPLTELADKKIKAAQYIGNKLVVYWESGENQIGRSFIDDSKGTLEPASSVLFTIQEETAYRFFAFGSSPNGNYKHVFSASYNRKDDGKTFDGVITDNSDKTVRKFTYTTPEDKHSIRMIKSIQSDDGSVYIIYGAIVKKRDQESYKPIEYTILKIPVDGKVAVHQLNDLPEGNIQNLSWQIKGADILFNGLLAKDKKTDFTTFLSGTYDLATGKVITKETELNTLASFRQLDDTYLKKISSKGLPGDIEYDTTIYYKDGSYALIYESNNNYQYQSYFAPDGSGINKPSYSVNFLLRGNIYVIKVSPLNQPDWIKVIPKDQEEPDINLCIGFACTIDEKSNLHFFFYDVEKNTEAEPGKHSPARVNTAGKKRNSFACVKLTPTGVANKQFIDIADNDFYISPERSAGIKAGELAYISMRKKGAAFGLVQLLNNAIYHFGTITIR